MLFHYNVHSVFLLFGFLQGIIFAGLAWWRGWREDRLSDKLLAVLLLICSLDIAQYMLGFAGWYDSHDAHSTFMFYFPFHQILFLGPVIYFYFRSLTNTNFRIRRRDWWHFVPGLLKLGFRLAFFLWDVVWLHWVKGLDMPEFFNTKGRLASFYQGGFSAVVIPLEWISIVVYLVLTIIHYQRYRRYINNHFSDTENIRFNWLRNLLYATVVGMTLSLLVSLLGAFVMSMNYAQFWNKFFAEAVMIYFVSIIGYTATVKLPRQLSFEPDAPEPEAAMPETATTAPDPELNRWKDRLIRYMDEHQPYLQSELTLSDLAQQLKTNSSVLSRVINSGLGQNFNDFINTYRVRVVQKSLDQQQDEQFTLMSIALDAGFNSKATFNRAFKKFTGQSPREYAQSRMPGDSK